MKKKRIVIDISIEEDSKLEENSSLCGLKTKVSFIREALAAYYWMIEQKQLGKNIFSQEPGKNLITQLESLALRNVPLKIQKDK